MYSLFPKFLLSVDFLFQLKGEKKKLEIFLFSTAAANRFVYFIRVFKVFSAVNGTGCCIAKRKGGGGMAAVEGRKRRMAWHRAFFVDWVHRYVAHCDYVSAWNQVCRFPFLRRLCTPAHLMNVFFQRHAMFRGLHREISILLYPLTWAKCFVEDCVA